MNNKQQLGRRYGKHIEAMSKLLISAITTWLDIMRKDVIQSLNRIAKDEAMDWVVALTDWGEIESSGERIFKPLILNIIKRSADMVLADMMLKEDFDVLNVRSIRLAESICATLVREVTNNTQQAIAQVIRDGLNQGHGYREMAKQIRPLVGLTERQIRAVANHEEFLLLTRPELSRREIDRRVNVYERRLHRKRADVIARTESARAVSEGSLEGYEYANIYIVIWNAAYEACPACNELDDKEFAIEQARNMIPYHPNCRCSWIPKILQ